MLRGLAFLSIAFAALSWLGCAGDHGPREPERFSTSGATTDGQPPYATVTPLCPSAEASCDPNVTSACINACQPDGQLAGLRMQSNDALLVEWVQYVQMWGAEYGLRPHFEVRIHFSVEGKDVLFQTTEGLWPESVATDGVTTVVYPEAFEIAQTAFDPNCTWYKDECSVRRTSRVSIVGVELLVYDVMRPYAPPAVFEFWEADATPVYSRYRRRPLPRTVDV